RPTQDDRDEIADRRLVLAQDDPLVAARSAGRGRAAPPGGPVGRGREQDPERRPAIERAVERDVATALLDDPIDRGEPEAGPAPGWLCREEGLEDPVAGRGVHPDPAV